MTIFWISSALGLDGAAGVPVDGRGFIHLPLTMDSTGGTRLMTRAGAPAPAALYNDYNGDLVNITIGGQTVSVLIDTGSFELWVNPNCSSVSPQGQHSASATALCEMSGQYDPSASKTSVDLDEDFSTQYGRGSANGTYFSDDIEIAGITVKNQRFAVANSSDQNPTGILGLGPDPYGGFNNSEPSIGEDLDTYMASPYSLLLTSMVSQGLINSRAFSLDLGSLQAPNGSLILGGVDKGRFQGTLQTFPLITESGTATLSNGTSVDIPLYAYEFLPMPTSIVDRISNVFLLPTPRANPLTATTSVPHLIASHCPAILPSKP